MVRVRARAFGAIAEIPVVGGVGASSCAGAGDLKATTTGDHGTTIEIPNVILALSLIHI